MLIQDTYQNTYFPLMQSDRLVSVAGLATLMPQGTDAGASGGRNDRTITMKRVFPLAMLSNHNGLYLGAAHWTSQYRLFPGMDSARFAVNKGLKWEELWNGKG